MDLQRLTKIIEHPKCDGLREWLHDLEPHELQRVAEALAEVQQAPTGNKPTGTGKVVKVL